MKFVSDIDSSLFEFLKDFITQKSCYVTIVHFFLVAGRGGNGWGKNLFTPGSAEVNGQGFIYHLHIFIWQL